MLDWDVFHLKIRVYFYVDDLDDTTNMQETDIHYNSKGWAEYNWRIVFKFSLPSKKTRLKFQIVSCPFFLNPLGPQSMIREIT